MAQTQKYEKVVILNSSLDNNIFPSNTSISFTNRIYPINQDQTYDAVYPMFSSVPLIQEPSPEPDPDPPTVYFRLNDKGRKIFTEPYTLLNSTLEVSIMCQSIGNWQTEELPLKLKFSIQMKPRLDISKHVFYKKQNIDTFCDFFLFIEHGNYLENATDDFIVITPDDNPMFGCLRRPVTINKHLFWSIKKDQTLTWNLKGTFENSGSVTATIGLDNKNYVYKRLYKESDIRTIHWNAAEIEELLTIMNDSSNDFNMFNVYFRNVKATFPEDIWDEFEFAVDKPLNLSDDNQQIYVHCNQINLTRIANQNEPIFQDMFISNNAIESGRLTEYSSIPNHIPLTLNTDMISEMSFEFLNALGEQNNFIDLERSTIIVCKLIKKYYDFSDAQKKTYLTNIFTY